MISVFVFLFFFALLSVTFFAQKEMRFLAILTGLLFFPHIIAFRNSPYISPQNLLLYIPLFVEYFKDPTNYKKAIKSFPLKIPLLILCITSCATALHISGSPVKNLYDTFRYIFDTYAFFFLAYWFGLQIPAKKLITLCFIPIAIFASFGVIEFMIGANYPYKMICSSFPIYQGIYDLNSSVSLSQDWRSRICITTHHPNTLTPILLSLIFLFLPTIKKEAFKYKLLFVVLFALVFIAGSRTGMLCLGGLVAVYATRKAPIMIKITIIFAFFVFLFYQIYNIIDYFNAGNGSSLTMRLDQLLYALVMFFQDPVFGNGSGYMAENIFEVDAYGEKHLADRSVGALESFLFRLLIDFGFIGVGAQLILIGFLVFYFFKRRKEYTAALGGIYVTIATYMFVFLAGDSAGTFRFTFLIIGLCLGNCVSKDLKKKEEESEKKKEDTAHLESEGNKASNLSEARLSLN